MEAFKNKSDFRNSIADPFIKDSQTHTKQSIGFPDIRVTGEFSFSGFVVRVAIVVLLLGFIIFLTRTAFYYIDCGNRKHRTKGAEGN